jgi:hypothetical protein
MHAAQNEIISHRPANERTMDMPAAQAATEDVS